MPGLVHRLQAQDLGFLEIVAEMWGVVLSAPDARGALAPLVRLLLNPVLITEIVDSLPEEARAALDELILQEGWMPWVRFTQKFGPLREVGPGKRDREKPYLDPISATEALWYRALLGRDFLMREGQLQECAYIPEDLLELLPSVNINQSQHPGRPASPGEIATIQTVTDRVLDHTCTLLASLRLGKSQLSPSQSLWQPPSPVVYALLDANKLITSEEQPVSEETRIFLEMPRGDALVWLFRGWRESQIFNELRLMPELTCEGAWKNDPLIARERILDWLSTVPEQTWWNIDSFIQAIYQKEPDFQRPAGDFDTWLIRSAHTGESLSGVQHWSQVDGALIRYIICGPLHWLGLIDLASPTKTSTPAAFRFSAWAERLLLDQPINELRNEDQPIGVFSDGTLTADTHTPRAARYQVSRFCTWVSETDQTYTYKLSPVSLSFAASQGLKINHLEALLNKYAETPAPSLISALRHWGKKGGQARISPAVILRVEDPRILQALRESKAGRFLGDPLGPTAVILYPGSEEKVASALARLGYLADVEILSDNKGEPEDVER